MRWAGALAVAAAVAASSACGGGRAPIRIGVLSDCQGGVSFLYESTLSGAELPLLDRGAKPLGDQASDGVTSVTVGGRRVELLIGCAASSSSSAVAEARLLVERRHADVVVGPQLTETYAVEQYAARRPGIAFVAGCCAPQSTTLRNAAPNFFSFSLDETQVGAGLGAYGFRQGWRRAVIIGQDEALHWGYAAGIVAEFCSLGGNIVKRIWISTVTDPSSLAASVPKEGVDGIFFLTPSGPQLLALLNGLPLLRNGLAGKVLGQATVFVDFSQSLGKRLDGAVYSTGGTNSNPGSPGEAYTDRLASAFPKLFRFTGLSAPAAGFALGYTNAMEAVLQAIERVRGDLSGDERRFMAELAKVELDAPNGHVRLDERHQAIAPNYLNRLTRNAAGKLEAHTFLSVPNVEQTFGGLFDPGSTAPGRTTPACRPGRPPSWAKR
jgi:branched-chain amino acid transport system substrate-binding protein